MVSGSNSSYHAETNAKKKVGRDRKRNERKITTTGNGASPGQRTQYICKECVGLRESWSLVCRKRNMGGVGLGGRDDMELKDVE
jgi:hypothetical protein